MPADCQVMGARGEVTNEDAVRDSTDGHWAEDVKVVVLNDSGIVATTSTKASQSSYVLLSMHHSRQLVD